MYENNPAGLERAKIKRVVGNQYNRLLRQQPDSKALSASESTTTRGTAEKRRRDRAANSRATALTAEGRATMLTIA